MQDLNRVDNYLVGKYDIEVLTLPRLKYTVEIKRKAILLPIQIPTPGLANIILPSKGFGGIYTSENNKLEQIYHFIGKKGT